MNERIKENKKDNRIQRRCRKETKTCNRNRNRDRDLRSHPNTRVDLESICTYKIGMARVHGRQHLPTSLFHDLGTVF